MLTVAGCTIQNNVAIGGRAGNGGNVGTAGNGSGGGLCAAGGTVTLHTTSVTGNTAKGGSGHGATGQGIGGGIYIDVAASVGLDAFTVDHMKRNHASTSDDNIHGSYAVIV